MEKILLVDDEPFISNAFRRGLAGSYEFLSANSAAEALTLIKSTPSLAVIVADMSMPSMNGAELLKEAAKFAPNAVRVMLTGLADQKTAGRAINEGSVYRFLTKPCSVGEFEQTLKDCLIKRQLQNQERELLQNTVGGVISLITDLLSSIDPNTASQSNNLRKIIRELFKTLPINHVEVELASMLSAIGRLSLPLELLLKISKADPITANETKLCEQSLKYSAKLLKHIPRLDKVSQLIELATAEKLPEQGQQRSNVLAFRVAKKIELQLNTSGESLVSALNRITDQLSKDELLLVGGLIELPEDKNQANQTAERFTVEFNDLCPGQRLVEDILDVEGKLLLKQGFIISEAVIARIKNHDQLVGVKFPIIVNQRIPTSS